MYAERLTRKQRETAARHLEEIPDGQRQAVLDELEGRLRADRQGAKPVYDEVSYLRHLCAKVKAGEFEANMGPPGTIETWEDPSMSWRPPRAKALPVDLVIFRVRP